MKIDRTSGEDRNAQPAGRPLEPKTGAVQSVVNVFDAALRQFRQRERAAREEPARRAEDKQKTAPPRPDTETPGAPISAPLVSVSAGWPESADVRPFPLPVQPGSEPQGNTPAPREQRRKRTAEEPEGSGCVEVVHPQSGARFLLSQHEGVWLLSVSADSGLDTADLETLRAQFAECGLGPVDIIIV